MRQPTKDRSALTEQRHGARPRGRSPAHPGVHRGSAHCPPSPDPQYQLSSPRQGALWVEQAARKGSSLCGSEEARVVQREVWRDGSGGPGCETEVFEETFSPRLLLTAKGSQLLALPPNPSRSWDIAG